MTYDLELSDLITKELKRIYKIEDENEAYKYFLCRFICTQIDKFNTLKKDIPNLLHTFEYRKSIINYTLNELDLITNNDFILYKNTEISVYGTGDNSIINTLIEMEANCVDLFFKDEFFKDIESLIKKSLNSAKRKCSSKKNSAYYNYYLIYYSLLLLNKKFGIEDIEEPTINMNNSIEFYQSIPSLKIEDKCCRYIDSIDHEQNDSLKVDEETLEKFLYKNLNIIEDGLIPIKRQYVIKDGRLDILAKDKNGIYTIIELKVEHDTDLIFQCIHYSTQLKLEKKLSKVRVITICPEYTYGLLNSLKHISKDYNVESYVCLIKSNNIKSKKINSLKLIKVI